MRDYNTYVFFALYIYSMPKASNGNQKYRYAIGVTCTVISCIIVLALHGSNQRFYDTGT